MILMSIGLLLMQTVYKAVLFVERLGGGLMAWSAKKSFNKQGVEAREAKGEKSPKKMSRERKRLRRQKSKNKGKRRR